MIIIVSDPTSIELESLKKFLGDAWKTEPLDLKLLNQKPREEPMWLSKNQFIEAMNKKGYQCKCSITRKQICDAWGVKYEKRGKEFTFRNELHKIPDRRRQM